MQPLADDLFTDTNPSERIAGASSPLLLVWSVAGGEGATTVALTAAEVAAAGAHLQRVMVADLVRDRGDVRGVLRLGEKAPSMAASLVGGKIKECAITPRRINGLRPETVPDVSFGTLLAPNYTQVTDGFVQNSPLINLVNRMRLHTNLVIADCGTPDYSTDQESQLTLIAELMQQGAYSIIVFEPNYTSTRHLSQFIKSLRTDYKLSRDRIMVLPNKRQEEFTDAKWQKLKENLSPVALTLEPVPYDYAGIGKPFTAGTLPTGQPELASAVATAMHRMTGNDAFVPIAESTSKEARRLKAVKVNADPNEAEPASRKGSRRFKGLKR